MRPFDGTIRADSRVVGLTGVNKDRVGTVNRVNHRKGVAWICWDGCRETGHVLTGYDPTNRRRGGWEVATADLAAFPPSEETARHAAMVVMLTTFDRD